MLDRVGNARFVMIGEAPTRRTSYKIRADLTKLLIEEKALTAVEANWPDARRVNR